LSQAIEEAARRLGGLPNPTKGDLERVKLEVSRIYRLGRVLSDAEVLRGLAEKGYGGLASRLKRKPVRSMSGVVVVAAMTRPWPCPHGRCAYCPGGPRQGTPQSYTGREPAAMRGAQHNYNPYLQVASRLRQLSEAGHPVDKCELIVMGGNFSSLPQAYQEWFVKGCLDALSGSYSQSLEEAKARAQQAPVRNVGITVEIRPDGAGEGEIDRLLSLGVTRVELGAQNPRDDVYRLVGRGHSVQDLVDATRRLKDAGLKVGYHMMLGLPGSDPEADLESFKRIFQDSAFKPDMLKIYPCLVLRGTELYEWWAKGGYRPYSTEEAAELIAEIKRIIPPWVRIMRVQRDIPAPIIVDGVKRGDLRELALRRLEEEGGRCRCIRCREAGRRSLKGLPAEGEPKITSRRYPASEGEEIFISFEIPESDALIGYIRLRIPSPKAWRREVAGGEAALVRELHIYGPLVPIGERGKGVWQHKGFGRMLLAEAERAAAEEYGARKILVTSGLGVKEYYSRLGYRAEGPYMAKALRGQKGWGS